MRRNLLLPRKIRILLIVFLTMLFGSHNLRAGVTDIIVGAQIGNLTYGTSNSVTFQISFNRTGTNPSISGLSVSSTLPTGVSAVWSNTSSSASGNHDPAPVTLTLTTSSNTSAGTYTFTVKSTNPTLTSTGTLTISQAALKITANNQSKCYGQTSSFAGTEFTSSGLLNSDAVSSVTLTSAGSGTGATSGSYSIVPIAATGTGLSNYTISYINGTLTVIPANTITAPSVTTFCATSESSDITIVGSDMGSGASYQWQVCTNPNNNDNGCYADISGATSKDYNPGTITNSNRYRRKVGGACASTSNIIGFVITPAISNNTISPQALLSNCGPITEYYINGSYPSGGYIDNFTFQWQSSTDGVNFSNIASTGQGYAPNTISNPIYFRRIAYSGNCTSYSNVLFYNTKAAIISGNLTVNVGSTTQLTGSPTGGTWSSGTTSVAIVNSSGLVSGVSGGTSIITYTTTDGCINSVTVSVTGSSCTNVGITSATAAASPICSNATTILTANGVVGTNALVTWWSASGGNGTNYGTGLTLANASPGNYYARVTGDCGAPVEALVTVVSNPNASIGSVTGTSPLCIGSTDTYSANQVVLSGGSGAWSTSDATIATVDASGLVTGVANGSCDIIYTITGGCGGTQTAKQALTVGYPGDPAVFGSGQWNVYVYNGANSNLSSNTYRGYYSDSNLSFDTRNIWLANSTPSSATDYQGCSVDKLMTFVYKRKGFPCGLYTISVGHDDDASLLINGGDTWSAADWTYTPVAVSGNYFLDENSTVELRIRNTGGGDSYGELVFSFSSTVPTPPNVISGTAATCSQITANWSASTNATKYYLDVSTVSDFSSFVSGYNNLDVSNVTTYNVTGLSAGTTYYYRVRASNSCGTSADSGVITYATLPNASIASVSGASPLCIGSTDNYQANSVVLGGGSGAWSSSDPAIATVNATTGLVTAVASGTCDIIYTILGGCGGTPTQQQSVTVVSPVGDPSVFGDNQWNIYAYQGNNINLSGITYKGYYTESNFSFSISDRWRVLGSPDEAIGYQGCEVTDDNHTFVYKREGFTLGTYQITVGHDDGYQLYIDGVLIGSTGGWDNRNPEVLSTFYTLNGTSKIEFRVAENGGDSRGALTFTEVCTNPTDGGFIAGAQSICYNSDPVAFTSSSVASGETGDLEYKWQSSTTGSSSGFSDITPIATGLTYNAPTGLTQTTWYKRLSKVTCSSIWATTGESNVLEITVKPQPTLVSITATPTSACTGSNVTITVNGLLDGINTINYDYTNNGSTTSTSVDLTASGSTATTTLNGLAAGNYQVKIKSVTLNGCTTNFTTNNTVTWILNDFPVITNPGTQTACDSYTLPTITGTNLSGNQKYYNNSHTLGGSVIIGPITSTQTVWIYDTNGTCSDEKNFLVTINPLPTAFNVTGGGTYCMAGSVGLSGSQIGVTYHLYENGVSTGSSVSGTGDAISFGNQLAGTYTVVATISNGDCPAQMTGSAVVTIGDTEKPAITKCLPGGKADCVKNLPAAITTIQGFIDAGGEVTDNCTAPMTVSYNDVITPGSPCEVRRTYTITDASGNKATCIQVFTITDLTKPVISCNDDLVSSPNTSGCAATLDITAPTAISDECSLVNIYPSYNYRLGDNAGSDMVTGTGSFTATFPEGITTINWTITDLCGNTSKPCAQIVQVGFSPTAISYDNGSTANGLGSGEQPMQTSTHEYYVDNKKTESGYTYSWGLFVNNGGVPGAAVDPSFYSITKVNLADIQVTFKNTNSIPEGNYIVSVIKTQMATTCQKQTTLPITVQSNSSFDVAIDNLGNQCQAPSGNLTTISWNVTFPNVITEPFVFSYSIKLGGTVVASGNVANITYAGAIPMLGLSAGAQTSKSANFRAIVIYYSLYGVSGNDLARTVEIEINATDVFQVSEPNRTNNIDDLKINQVPVITFE